MNKILLIIEREFMTRVKKKSFIILTLLTPILFAALMVGPTYLASLEVTEVRTIGIVDNSNSFVGRIPDTDYIKFTNLNNTPIDYIKKNFDQMGYYAVLSIDSLSKEFTIFSAKQPSIDVTSHIESSIEKEIETRKLKSYNIENLDKILADIKTKVDVKTIKLSKAGEEKESNTLVTMGIAYVLSFLMYMMVLLSGTQVMQGVIEEKTNRIVEVIISSAKPFQLMMGKIIGLAAVSLVQIMAWIILTYALGTIGIAAFAGGSTAKPGQTEQVMANELQQPNPAANIQTPEKSMTSNDFMKLFDGQNIPFMLGCYIFYFIFGFLLYASLFAAVGSAVDSITDTQQLTTPITIPLILAIIVMISGIKSPDGPLAFWFSMIPFTSPIIMLTRIPFGVPTWQLVVSALLLVVTFVAVTWMAAKIYRTGILLYGKKHTWKEMWKWVRYSS
jgi:ABC-2 type transport system permease protein